MKFAYVCCFQASSHLSKGHLNYDVWRWVVGFMVNDLRIKREFPNKPTVSDFYYVYVLYSCFVGNACKYCCNQDNI